MRALFIVLIAGACGAFGAAPAMAHHGHGKGRDRGGGFVYTETQDPAGNAIVVYKRAANGALTERKRVPTGGVGASATPPFGFPIVDSQGSLELTRDGRLLFAVNAGDDTISAFKVKRGGDLQLVDRRPSGGDLPVSLDSNGRLLYVVNSLSGNISGFRYGGGGKLKPIAGSSEPDSAAAGSGVPAQIGFAPNGRVLTVTLRGTQTVDTFRLGRDDTPGPARANHSNDENPFGFEYRGDGLLVLSNAGHAGDPTDPTTFHGRAATYSLHRDTSLSLVDSIDVTGQRATCWVVLTGDQRYAFMTNTLSQSVSRFSVARNGKLTLLGNVATGAGFASDEALSKDGRFLYVLLPSIMGGMSHIDSYRVGAGGSLTHIGATPSNLPLGASGLAAR
jgi:6-phosphogluconolactonase (cycloisomerase 2 family)